MKVQWVFRSYSTTSSVRMATVRVSPDFNHLSGPIRPLNHSRNQEKTSFFFSNSFLFCPMMTSLKETLWRRGGAPRLDATRCYSPWPAVTRLDSPLRENQLENQILLPPPPSSPSSPSSPPPELIRRSVSTYVSIFNRFFPAIFPFFFGERKTRFVSLLFLFSTAPAFLPSLRPPGSRAQIEHKQIDFFYRQWEGTTMLEFLFLILCFIYSLFILYDIIKYLKLYLIFNLYFILYFILYWRRRRSIYLSSRKAF